MQNSFKRAFAILSLLTTLFVSATPLNAAVAADGQNKDEIQSCSTSFAQFASDEQVVKLKAQGGTYIVISAQSDTARFVKHWNAIAPVPFPKADFDVIVVSISGPEAPYALITLFKDNCQVIQGYAPILAVPELLSDGDPA